MSLFVKEITCENEFPDIVNVICVNSSGVIDERDYVPERTTRISEGFVDSHEKWYECTECGLTVYALKGQSTLFDYGHCPSCGCKVVE